MSDESAVLDPERVAPPVAARRLFIGVPVSLRCADDLSGAAESLARRALAAKQRVRWVAPASYHVTLKYVGWVRPALFAPLVAAARDAASGRRPFTFRAARLGAFPDSKRATVVWAGVEDGGGHLTTLANRLDEACAALGIPRDGRAFHPHVTLGRLGEPAAVSDVLLPFSEQVFSETRSHDLIIYESEAKTKGSEYVEVARIPLGAP